ncbi:MAG: hypothetical protein R3E96_12765 [Planctomycetota bacterium]
MKDSFCAVSEPSCGSCQATPARPSVSAAPTRGSGLNDGAQGVSVSTSTRPPAPGRPTGSPPPALCPFAVVSQFPTTEAADSNSIYISEAQYISEHDHWPATRVTTPSWQEFRFVNGSLSNGERRFDHMFDPAIFAWQNEYPDVYIDELVNTDEGGASSARPVFVASKATDLGGGNWRTTTPSRTSTRSKLSASPFRRFRAR